MSKAVKFIKNNLFLLAVVIAYLTITIIHPSLGALGIKNSGYYVKEMLMIILMDLELCLCPCGIALKNIGRKILAQSFRNLAAAGVVDTNKRYLWLIHWETSLSFCSQF